MDVYFKSLLDNKSEKSDTNPFVSSSHTVPILDEAIDDMEVRTALKARKKNKVPGLNGLPPLVFKMFHDQLVKLATALFNKLLKQESYPEIWSSGSIKPIPKKGYSKCPSNYRGITLFPVMGKVFITILRNRLLDWAKANGKLCESQFEFRPWQGRQITDVVFIIAIAIQSFKKRKKAVIHIFYRFCQGFRFSKSQVAVGKTCHHGCEH